MNKFFDLQQPFDVVLAFSTIANQSQREVQKIIYDDI